MCGVLVGLLRARQALLPKAGVMVQRRANYILGKPPKDNIGAAESAFVLTVMSLLVLGPSGWILANLDHYKNRD